MELMVLAIFVDLTLYGLAGFALVKLAKRFLPDPWNDPHVTVPVFITVGALITLLSFPHWLVFPKHGPVNQPARLTQEIAESATNSGLVSEGIVFSEPD